MAAAALRHPGEPGDCRAVAAVAALLTAGLFLRLLFYTGPIGSDDVSYFGYARRLLAGISFAGAESPHQGGRLVFLALVGLPAAWFDHIHYGALSNVLLFSLRDLLVVAFALRVVGAWPAAFAAAFLALNPLSILDAGLMVPDGLVSLGMAACTLAAHRAIQAGGRGATAWAFGAGACAAIGYSAKDTGILVVAPTAVALALWLPGWVRLQALVAFAAGFALLAGLEMAALWHLSGDPLFRVHAVADVHNQGMGGDHGPRDFLRIVYWNLHAQTRWHAASLPVLVVLVVGAALAARSRIGVLVAGTGGFLALYLLFGSTSLTRLVPVPAQDRYLEPLVPYAALCVAVAAGRLAKPAARRAAAWLAAFVAALGAAAAPSVSYNAGDVTFSMAGQNTAAAIESARAAYPDLPLYAPKDVIRRLEAFVSPATYAQLRAYPQTVPLPPGLYVVHPWERSRLREPNAVNREIAAMRVVAAAERDRRTLAPIGLTPPRLGSRGEVRSPPP